MSAKRFRGKRPQGTLLDADGQCGLCHGTQLLACSFDVAGAPVALRTRCPRCQEATS